MSEANDDEMNAFEGLFRDDGTLDVEGVGGRLPALYTLIRSQSECFDLRVYPEDLSAAILGEAGAALRDAQGDAEFEAALRSFSQDHLHELFIDERMSSARDVLQALADDAELPEEKRRAAAVGVALTGGLPDDHGYRGRALGDVILRISLEELHAHEDLRRRARESDEGLSAEELKTFWDTYPAVRHHFEARYRRDVASVVAAIEADILPAAISVDLAIRGVHRLLSAVAKARGEEEALDGDAASAILQQTFESDMLDNGRELMTARWAAALTVARERDGAADDDPDIVELERALRIIAPGGPGREVIFFHAYARSVVEGSFHVLDAEEATAARQVFGDDGLEPDGVLGFATYLRGCGDTDAEQRSLLAGLELWPEHDGIRAAATALAEERLRRARKVRQGPTYHEAGETFSEID